MEKAGTEFQAEGSAYAKCRDMGRRELLQEMEGEGGGNRELRLGREADAGLWGPWIPD